MDALEVFLGNYYEKLIKRGISKEEADEKIDELREKYQDEIYFDDTYQCEDWSLKLQQELKNYSMNIEVDIREKRVDTLRRYYENLESRFGFTFFPLQDRHIIKDIDVHGIYGRTRIIDAAFNGDYDLVEELLAEGADLTLTDNNGHNALQVALIEGHDGIVDLLRDC